MAWNPGSGPIERGLGGLALAWLGVAWLGMASRPWLDFGPTAIVRAAQPKLQIKDPATIAVV